MRADAPDAGVKLTLSATQKPLSASANFNNRASRAVGREQILARAAANNLLTGVDQIGLSTVQSIRADELSVYAGRYSTVLTTEGLSLNLAATRSDAAPGIPFLRVLGFETEGWTARAGLSFPLIMSRDVKLGVSGMVNWKEFRSAFGVTPNTVDRLWTTDFDATFSIKDRWDGLNAVGLSLAKGWDLFDATMPGDPLASRAGAGGEFFTIGAEISRTQRLATIQIRMNSSKTWILPRKPYVLEILQCRDILMGIQVFYLNIREVLEFLLPLGIFSYCL